MLRLKAKLKDSKCDPILFRQHLEISDKDAERFLVTFLGPSYSTRDEKQVKQRMTLENLKRFKSFGTMLDLTTLSEILEMDATSGTTHTTSCAT
jgi:hypothetical protein